MPTSYDKLSNNDIILPGLNRLYAIGDTAYRYIYRQHSQFAKLIPVTYIDGKWQETQLSKVIYKEIYDYCTLLS